jgi:hypothetical protein
MGRHVAIAITPLGGGIRRDEAIFTGGEFLDSLAALTLLNDRMARTTVKLAAFLAHEKTLVSFFYACTNHSNHILSV